MKLIDPISGEMICNVCGAKHWARIRPGSNGNFYRGSWQCQNGCKMDTEPEENDSKKL